MRPCRGPSSNGEICQMWNNSSQTALGLVVYGWSNGAMNVLCSSQNMGQGSGAISWLIGDVIGEVNGVGGDEICQMWNNSSQTALGMVVYKGITSGS